VVKSRVYFETPIYILLKHRFDPDCGVLYKLLLNRPFLETRFSHRWIGFFVGYSNAWHLITRLCARHAVKALKRLYMTTNHVILHVPHSSTVIPDDCQFLLTKSELGVELEKLTDHQIHTLFSCDGAANHSPKADARYMASQSVGVTKYE